MAFDYKYVSNPSEKESKTFDWCHLIDVIIFLIDHQKRFLLSFVFFFKTTVFAYDVKTNYIDNHSIEERSPLVCTIEIVQDQQFVNDCKIISF